jgi:hypothetical protein
MKQVRLRRGVLAAFGIIVLLGIAGGVAYAQVADSGPVIKACAGNVTGLLRQDQGRGCLPIEHAIQWNQIGPQGPPGPQGPVGPSRADEKFVARNPRDTSTWIPVNVATGRLGGTRLLTMHLDPGNYVVNTQVVAGNFTGIGTIVCITGNNALGGYAVGQQSLGTAGGYVRQANLSYQSTFAAPDGGDIELVCWNAQEGQSDPGQASVVFGDVIATKVDATTSTEVTG